MRCSEGSVGPGSLWGKHEGGTETRGTVQSFKDARSRVYWRANGAVAVAALVLCTASAAADDAGVPPLTNEKLSTLDRCSSADAGARPDDLSCLTLTVRQVCARAAHAPDRAVLVQLRTNAETLMRSLRFDAATLSSKRRSTKVQDRRSRSFFRRLRCNRLALAATELPAEDAFEVRAAKWAADADKAVALEQKARDEVINPVCQADSCSNRRSRRSPMSVRIRAATSTRSFSTSSEGTCSEVMGRKSTGTVRILKNEHGAPQWHAKWTRANGTRTEYLPLDPAIRLDDEAGAKAFAARMAPKVRLARAPGADPIVETVEAYAKRWCEWREARGRGCVADDRAALDKHVLSTSARSTFGRSRATN